MIYFETLGLVIRDWKDSDTEPFQKINNDPIVIEFFLKRLSFDESKLMLDKIQL